MTKGPYQQYLGNAVYADYDGYHVTLAVNHHDNVVVFLEPAVLQALNNYVSWLHEHLNPKDQELHGE